MYITRRPKLAARHVEAELVRTERVNHAREIGRSKDFTGFDGVVVLRGNHLSNTTCLTHVFFKSGE